MVLFSSRTSNHGFSCTELRKEHIDQNNNEPIKCMTNLDESNVSSALAEALSANVQVVLSDDGVLVVAHAASASASGAQRGLGV